MAEQRHDLDQKFQNSELIDAITYNNEKDFWLTEYQCIISQFTTYVGLYFLAFVVYLGIQGFLLISSYIYRESFVKMWIIFFSIICCILFYGCIVVAWTIVGDISSRKKRALEKLGIENVTDEFSIGKSASYVFLVFNFFLLISLFILGLTRLK